MFYDILERKNAFLGYKNKKFKKSKNWHFSKGVNPWFWSKNGHFSNFYFLGNVDQENVFYDILERKYVFLDYKNKKFKNSKNWHFFKGVNSWFWSKKSHFSSFLFLPNLNKKNVFFDILERKMRFQAIKTRSTKSRKIDVFPKGLTHGFGTKMASFPTFLFGNLNQENVFYDILENNTPFYAIKKKVQKTEKLVFFQRG